MITSVHSQTFFLVDEFLDLRVDFAKWFVVPLVTGLDFLSFFFHLVLNTIIIFIIFYTMLKVHKFLHTPALFAHLWSLSIILCILGVKLLF